MSVNQALKEIGFPEGKFGTVILDPPWSFSDKGSRVAPDWKESNLYNTMSAREILDLPVDLLAADQAHCYVWTTDVHLPLALNCLQHWGFVYKKTLVWVKRRSAVAPISCTDADLAGEFEVSNGPLQIGMGHYYRSAKELCLFGTRGKCPAAVHNLPDVFEAQRTKHSVKPDRIHEWAEKLSPGPRVELFARRSKPGWEAWGDQFPGHDAYLRSVQEINRYRVEERALTKAKHAKRRAKIRWENLEEGTSRWGGRCAECREIVAAGDPVHYLIDEPVSVCRKCVEEWQRGAVEVPKGEVPF